MSDGSAPPGDASHGADGDAEDRRVAGHDAFLDSIAAGEGYYLRCQVGHGSLPPRTVCPHCGGELTVAPLPETGTVVARTVVRVSADEFVDAAPYVSAVAEFPGGEQAAGERASDDAPDHEAPGVRLTGIVRGADPAPGDAADADAPVPGYDVDRGDTVRTDVATVGDERRSLVLVVE